MSGEREVKPSSPDIFRSEESDKKDDIEVPAAELEEEEDYIQDQIILVPEMMEKILDFLDFQSLKKVRLVCKRWLLEAQTHMERRGIVYLNVSGAETEDKSIQSFLHTYESKIRTLPVPFQALNAVVSDNWRERLQFFVPQLLSLSPPFHITQLDTETIPLTLVVPLVSRFSSSLEYLHLCASGFREEFQPMDPQQTFPKLRHLYAETQEDIDDNTKIHFPSIVSWLVSSSKNLETYEFKEVRDGNGLEENEMELISALVTQVDASNVKAFKFECSSGFNDAAVSHFSSIAFRRLEALQLRLTVMDGWKKEAMMSVLARSFMTLKALDLSFIELDEEDQAKFPTCPNVEQVRLTWFTGNFLPTHFPALHTMTIECYNQELAAINYIPTPPFSGLKRLRIKNCQTTQSEELVDRLFENCPAVEALYLENINFMFGSSLVSSWAPIDLNLLQGVKHLVVYNDTSEWSCKDLAGWYSLLSFLTGLESIEVNTDMPELITTLPLGDLPHLDFIQFPWDDSLDMRKLLQIARGLKKVSILNCCSVLKSDDVASKSLKTFFESAPNAECGCDHELWSQWFPEDKFMSAYD